MRIFYQYRPRFHTETRRAERETAKRQLLSLTGFSAPETTGETTG
ncbi:MULTISPECIES: hypothetical protein [Microcystis]|nr:MULTISPECIES: hypothetical protein [Microcystis]